MTTPAFALLVGTRFARGASALLACLPQGTRVELRPEPDNPHDAEAIRVVLALPSAVLSEGRLAAQAEVLAGAGLSPSSVLAEPEWTLGHIGASEGKPLALARASAPGPTVGTSELAQEGSARSGRLFFAGENVWIELSEEEEPKR